MRSVGTFTFKYTDPRWRPGGSAEAAMVAWIEAYLDARVRAMYGPCGLCDGMGV